MRQRAGDDRERARDWCRFSGTGTAYIEPGSPWQNPYVESFGSRVRDELLDVEEFSCLAEAQVVIERLARGLQRAPAALRAWDEDPSRSSPPSWAPRTRSPRQLDRGGSEGAPRPSPLRLAPLGCATTAAHLFPRSLRREPANVRTHSYLDRNLCPPTLTRGGPRTGVRSPGTMLFLPRGNRREPGEELYRKRLESRAALCRVAGACASCAAC